MIVLDRLTKSFGAKPVLQGVSLEVPDGQNTVMIGASGSGKSVTLKLIVGLLEPEATTFSIPSKVLTYMASGRPLIGLMPMDNPAAADITTCGGFVAEPTPDGAQRAAAWLADTAADEGRRDQIGRQTRDVAEEKFDPDRITSRFEAVITGMAGAVAR